MKLEKEEKKIIQDILKGDSQKYQILVERHSQKIYALALSLLQNREDAEEITQNSFLKAFQALGSFKGKSKFSSYLYRICYNESINLLRQRKQSFSLEQIVEEPEELNQIFYKIKQEEQKKFLNLALEKLAPDYRMVLNLFYFEEQSIKEIINITGWSTSNTKVKLHRARVLLETELNRILNTELKNLM